MPFVRFYEEEDVSCKLDNFVYSTDASPDLRVTHVVFLLIRCPYALLWLVENNNN